MQNNPSHVINFSNASWRMVWGMARNDRTFSGRSNRLAVSRRSSSAASGGYSFVLVIVQSTALKNAAAPIQKEKRTINGMARSVVLPPGARNWPNSNVGKKPPKGLHADVDGCVKNPQQSRRHPQDAGQWHENQRNGAEDSPGEKKRTTASERAPGVIAPMADDRLQNQPG